jgi:hypothetical protein
MVWGGSGGVHFIPRFLSCVGVLGSISSLLYLLICMFCQYDGVAVRRRFIRPYTGKQHTTYPPLPTLPTLLSRREERSCMMVGYVRGDFRLCPISICILAFCVQFKAFIISQHLPR